MAKKPSSALARLTPTALSVKDEDGTIMRVPISADENKIMSWLMAARMRALIECQMEKYKAQDVTMTPKDLADMATAVSRTEQFAAEAYKGPEVPLGDKGPDSAKTVEGEPVNFDILAAKKEEPEKPKE